MDKNRAFKNGLFKGITANIIILGLVSMFTDLGSQIVFPLIPLFLVNVLGASAVVVGLVEGAAEATASLLKVFSGYWSDKIRKRRLFVLLGYGLSTITKPLFAFSAIWQQVLGIRIIERIGKGVREAPRDAIVAESVKSDVRGKAYGIERAFDGLGSVGGAVLALLLLPLLGFRKIFLFAFIPSLIAVLLILLVKEKKQKFIKTQTMRVSFKALTWQLKLFIIIAAIFALGNFGYAFLLLRALNLGLSSSSAIFLYILYYAAYTIFSTPAGILSDKIGRKKVLMLGYSLFALTSVGLILSSSLIQLVLFFITFGLFFAMIDGVQRAFVVDLSPSHLKGTALGTFHTITGLIAVPSGLVAGLLWERISPETTFFFGLILSVIALVTLLIFIKEKK